MMEYGILVLGWLIFCALHTVLAAEKSKQFFAPILGSHFKYYRLLYSVVAVITLSAVLIWQFSIPGLYLTVLPFFRYFISIPFMILALVLMGICIRKYFYKLSGVEVLFQPAGAPVLETGGVHRFVRHPLYAGTLLLIWSILLWFPSLANLIACVMITVYVRIGISIEERKLMLQFGSQYEEYKKMTPMLFPSL